MAHTPKKPISLALASKNIPKTGPNFSETKVGSPAPVVSAPILAPTKAENGPMVANKLEAVQKPVAAKVEVSKLVLVKETPVAPAAQAKPAPVVQSKPAPAVSVTVKPIVAKGALSTNAAVTSIGASFFKAFRKLNLAGFDHLKGLTAAGSLTEAFALQSAFVSEQVAFAQKQTQEISALTQKFAQETLKPFSAH